MNFVIDLYTVWFYIAFHKIDYCIIDWLIMSSQNWFTVRDYCIIELINYVTNVVSTFYK